MTEYPHSRTVGEHDPGTTLPSIWPTGATGLDRQLDERSYHAATATDVALMPPAIAEYAITALSRPGDIVLDPECGAGTTITEALRADRHAIGLTAQRRWWHLARANLNIAKAQGAAVDGMVLVLGRRPGSPAAATTAGMTGQVDLLLTSLRPADPAIHADQAIASVGARLAEYRPLLRPGGHVVITAPPLRHPIRHRLLDVPAALQTAAARVGLACVARCLALTAGIRGEKARTRAGFTARRQARRIERATGHPCALPAFHTALVFRADPEATDPALAHPLPGGLEPLRRHDDRLRPAA